MPPTPPPRRLRETPLYEDVVTEEQSTRIPGTRGGFGGDDDIDDRYRHSERGLPRRGFGADLAAHCESYRGVGPRGYRRPDVRILEDVCDRLTEDPRLDASGIEVAVAEAEVTLSGVVRSRECRRLAEALSCRALGVARVQNNLRVAYSFLGRLGRRS